MFSYWEQASFIKSPDVVIIGSGIVGLNAAISLKRKKPELHVLVLERGILPYGASTRNAGFACFGSPSELLEDLGNHSEADVFSLVKKRWDGLLRLRTILGDKHIGYEPLGGHEIFSGHDNELFEKCFSKLSYLNSQLKSITGVNNTYEISDNKISSFGFRNIKHIIQNKSEGQIDTGLMMKSLLTLARSFDVEILNGVNVERIEEASDGVNIYFSPANFNSPLIINAGNVLICVNGFAKKFLPDFDVQPARAQVLITSPISNLKIKGSFHFDHGYYYFRNVENRILLGGGRNSDIDNEYTDQIELTTKIQNNLNELLKSTILPQEKYTVEMRWSGIMGLGSNKSPIIKKTGEKVFCAVRMGGMGIAIGSLVGEEAAELVLNSL